MTASIDMFTRTDRIIYITVNKSFAYSFPECFLIISKVHVIDDQTYSAEFHEKNTFVRSISERYRNFRKLNQIRSFISIDRTDVSYIERFNYRLF